MKHKFFNLLFFGSDRFSVRVLDHITRKKLAKVDVVTKSGSLLNRFAADQGINVHNWPLELPIGDGKQFDIGLVASFGHLIDVETVKRFNYGLFNVHPSLLPKYRGSSPIQAAILDGLTQTGCTIIQIPPVAKFDIGDIVMQEKLTIKTGEYAFELADRLADLGAKMSEILFTNYDQCIMGTRPQTLEEVSYAKKINPQQGLIKFKIDSSDYIDRKVRAYTGTIDLFMRCLGNLEVKLEGMRDLSETESYNFERALRIHHKSMGIETYSDSTPGTMFYHKPRQVFGVKSADNRWVMFDYYTPPHRSRMSALEFYNGYLSSLKPEEMITDN